MDFDHNQHILDQRISYLKSANFEHAEKHLFNWTKNGNLTLEQFRILNDEIAVSREALVAQEKRKLCRLLMLIDKWFNERGYGTEEGHPLPRFIHNLKVRLKKLKKSVGETE